MRSGLEIEFRITYRRDTKIRLEVGVPKDVPALVDRVGDGTRLRGPKEVPEPGCGEPPKSGKVSGPASRGRIRSPGLSGSSPQLVPTPAARGPPLQWRERPLTGGARRAGSLEKRGTDSRGRPALRKGLRRRDAEPQRRFRRVVFLDGLSHLPYPSSSSSLRGNPTLSCAFPNPRVLDPRVLSGS